MTVYLRDDVERACCTIESVLRKILASQQADLALSQPCSSKTIIQTIFNLKFDNDLEKKIFELIVTYLVAAERLVPGTFVLTARMLLERFLQRTYGYGKQDHESASCVNVGASRPVDVSTLRLLVSRSMKDDALNELFMQALELAGFAGRIFVEKSSSSVDSIELVEGYTFALNNHLKIFDRLEKAKVVCVDGYVTEVHEIHSLLNSFSEAKVVGVVFARGFSDDVLNTLRVNYNRGSLKVLPLSVNYDLEGINTLVDIATVCNSDVVSTLKGDMISAIKFETLVTIDQLIPKDVVSIVNRSSRYRVQLHVADLVKRRDECENDDKRSLFEKRIRCLSPNHVMIRLVDDRDFVVRSQKLDIALRTTKCAIDFGTFEDDLYAKKVVAAHFAKKCAMVLSDVGAVLSNS